MAYRSARVKAKGAEERTVACLGLYSGESEKRSDSGGILEAQATGLMAN